MGFKCYLCNNAPNKEKKISLHRFPNRHKLPQAHQEWLTACGLDERDDVSTIRICSNHFREEEKCQIRWGVVPTIGVKAIVKVFVKKENTDDDELPTPQCLEEQKPNLVGAGENSTKFSETIVPNEELDNEIPHPDPPVEQKLDLIAAVQNLSKESESVILTNLHNMNDLDAYFEVLYNCMKENKICTTLTFPINKSSPITQHILSESINYNNTNRSFETTELMDRSTSEMEPKSEILNESNTTNGNLETDSADECNWNIEHQKHSETLNVDNEILGTTESADQSAWRVPITSQKKRRTFYPRYIQEIQLSDVSTPKRASLTIAFVKQSYQKKAIKIQKLQDTLRHLRKRTSSLEKQVSKLKKQKK